MGPNIKITAIVAGFKIEGYFTHNTFTCKKKDIIRNITCPDDIFIIKGRHYIILHVKISTNMKTVKFILKRKR